MVISRVKEYDTAGKTDYSGNESQKNMRIKLYKQTAEINNKKI